MAPRRIDPARMVRADLATAVLTTLSAAEAPTGATFLHGRLLASGYRLSEPTVGRLLREFDRLGYTTRHGKLGRMVTAKGRAELETLRKAKRRSTNATQVADRIRAETLEDVMHVIAARRGVERELARAAALNATAKDLAALRARLEAIRGGDVSEGLHDELARAAHNPVLESLYRMLTQDPDMKRLLDRLSDGHGKLVDLPFDRRLMDALAKHDADAAERAVVARLDEMMAIVKENWTAARKTRRRAEGA